MREQCERLQIDHKFYSVSHPQMNRQAELTNRVLLNGLKKKIKDAKSEWAELLNEILRAYRTTTNNSTGETPFLLIYGTEAMIPAEIGCPIARVLYFSPQNNEQGLRVNLDLLEESRLAAAMKNQAYRHKATQYHNARVKNMTFKQGDLVLRKLEATCNRESKGKLAPKWDGPFRVIKVVKANTYHLQDP
jgi:hypothetical protein